MDSSGYHLKYSISKLSSAHMASIKRSYACSITLCLLMGFPKHDDTISMGLPILYFKGSRVEVSKI